MLDLGKDAAGQVIDLAKEAGKEVTNVDIKLTWKKNTTSGKDYDPDVVAFGLGDDDKVVGGNEGWFVRGFGANNPKRSPDGKIRHGGDDTSGANGGETINVDAGLDAQVKKVRASVTIFHAKSRKHNFGLIKNCTVSVVDRDTGSTIVTGELSFDNSANTSVNALDLVVRNGKLYAQYVGEGYTGGLGGLCADHGIQIGRNDYDEGVDAN
jgi:tellurium resistance protein TerD